MQWCSGEQAHNRHCVTAITPMEICSPYSCAVSQQKCTAALVWAKCIPHCSVVLCKTGSQQALCHCNYSYGDLLSIQLCSELTVMHCSTGQGKVHSPLFSGVLENRLTTGTLSLQIHQWKFVPCSEPTVMHCSTGLSKMHSPLFSGVLENRLTTGTSSLQTHQWKFAPHTGVQ